MRKGKQGEKYTHIGSPLGGGDGGLAAFGFLANALGGGGGSGRNPFSDWPCDEFERRVNKDGSVTMTRGSGSRGEPGDAGQAFPRSDAEDLSRGLRFIPGEVTMARRRGEKVFFVHEGDHQCCWHWLFEDGSKTYYWEREDFHEIARENGKIVPDEGFKGDPGQCKRCGNVHTTGGYLTASEQGRKVFEVLLTKFRTGVDKVVEGWNCPQTKMTVSDGFRLDFSRDFRHTGVFFEGMAQRSERRDGAHEAVNLGAQQAGLCSPLGAQ